MKELTKSTKKVAAIIGVTTLPIAAASNVNERWNTNGMMDVTLANVEAFLIHYPNVQLFNQVK